MLSRVSRAEGYRRGTNSFGLIGTSSSSSTTTSCIITIKHNNCRNYTYTFILEKIKEGRNLEFGTLGFAIELDLDGLC